MILLNFNISWRTMYHYRPTTAACGYFCKSLIIFAILHVDRSTYLCIYPSSYFTIFPPYMSDREINNYNNICDAFGFQGLKLQYSNHYKKTMNICARIREHRI